MALNGSYQGRSQNLKQVPQDFMKILTSSRRHTEVSANDVIQENKLRKLNNYKLQRYFPKLSLFLTCIIVWGRPGILVKMQLFSLFLRQERFHISIFLVTLSNTKIRCERSERLMKRPIIPWKDTSRTIVNCF